MKRDIERLKGSIMSNCCPGHDDFPNDSYRNRKSKKARSRDKKVEHQYSRSLYKRILMRDLTTAENEVD